MDYEIIRIVWAWIITNGLCIAERGGEGGGRRRRGRRRRRKAKKVGEDQDTKERRGMR